MSARATSRPSPDATAWPEVGAHLSCCWALLEGGFPLPAACYLLAWLFSVGRLPPRAYACAHLRCISFFFMIECDLAMRVLPALHRANCPLDYFGRAFFLAFSSSSHRSLLSAAQASLSCELDANATPHPPHPPALVSPRDRSRTITHPLTPPPPPAAASPPRSAPRTPPSQQAVVR